jgi:S1-C subfamily serine protease
MHLSSDDQKSVEAVRARAREIAADEPGSGAGDAEILAALAEGTLSFVDIPEAALEHCINEFGADLVLDALMAAKGGPAGVAGQICSDQRLKSRDNVVPIAFAIAAWWRQPRWIGAGTALAVAVAMIGFLSIKSSRNPANRFPEDIKLALQWPSNPPFNSGTAKSWGSPKVTLAQVLPDFTRSTTTLGASREDRFTAWRLATVIVKSGNSWGSGAFISADGWILSTYRVVASQAQEAAIAGRPASVEVIAGYVVDGKMKPRTPAPATLYRADPVHDLALLKLQALPTGGKKMLHFQLAGRTRNGEDCFAVGSQGNGPAWWIRSGNVIGQFDSSKDRSRLTTGGEFDRMRATLIMTDARVSPGDDGGPLLNARGELIGLTTTAPQNLGRGPVAWHIALPDLRTFVANLPSEPEGVETDRHASGARPSTPAPSGQPAWRVAPVASRRLPGTERPVARPLRV